MYYVTVPFLEKVFAQYFINFFENLKEFVDLIFISLENSIIKLKLLPHFEMIFLLIQAQHS